MLQNKKLVIYPTSRAVRNRTQLELKQNGILPKIITIGEFEKKAVVVKDRIFIDQDTRIMLLNEASTFSTFSKLQIDREFFAFLKNSKYLFSFYDELAVELVDINSLEQYDTYASYSEHLEILSTLLKRYKELLNDKNYVDKLTLPYLYSLNYSFLENFNKIEFHLEGYLNSFEFKLLGEISNILPLEIYITTNRFNTKMIDKFHKYNITLKQNYDYIINLSEKKIIYEKKREQQNIEFTTHASSNRLSQVAFIKKKVFDYINLGIDPQNIVVIVPNSSFVKSLEPFDDENNFNFAMGTSYKETRLYKILEAKYDYFTTRNKENEYRLQRYNIDRDRLEENFKEWNKKRELTNIKEEFLSFTKDEPEDEISRIYLEELHLFSKLLPSLQHQPFHKLLHLFLNRLQNRTVDDTRGGKITVLEPLETRGVAFEAVIIVDFNEGVVPLINQKDMFLSSNLRFLASLPTTTDRENLQKYYYQRIFDNAKFVSISYIEDEQNQPSRFLDELDLPKNNSNLPSLESILFNINPKKSHFQQHDLILEYDFTKINLSATALKNFLECKRLYYFKYIKELEHAEIPKDDNSDRAIGIILHEALKELYLDNDAYFDQKELLYKLQFLLYQKSENQPNLRFLIDIWLEKLKPFIYNEIDRAKNGYKVSLKEEEFKLNIEGFKLKGQIDRIDIKENILEIIDYKSGKIPKDNQKSINNSTNFQLQFYYLLASQIGKVQECYYYDLSSGKLINDPFFDTKLDILYQKLEELKEKEHNFTMTDEIKKCKYCTYAKICNRIF